MAPYPNLFSQLKIRRYPLSKLLEVFYARELATRSRKSNKPIVVINLVNPGLCHSELSREGSWFMMVLKFFLARSTECGSRTLVQATEAGPESHGQYLSSCHVTPYILRPTMSSRANDVQAIAIRT